MSAPTHSARMSVPHSHTGDRKCIDTIGVNVIVPLPWLVMPTRRSLMKMARREGNSVRLVLSA